MIRINNKILVYIFIIVSVLLLTLTAITYIQVKKISSTAEDFQHHTQRLNLIFQAFYTFNDIESSTRGYFLLHDPLFLGIRERSISGLSRLMNRIEDELEKESVSYYYFKKSTDLYRNRVSYLDSFFRKDTIYNINSIFKNSSAVIEEARLLTDKMVLEENISLIKLDNQLKRHLNIAPDAILFLASFFIVILLLAYLSMAKQLKISKNLTKNLEDSNSSLEIANKSLAESRSFLQAVIDSSPDGILSYQAIRNTDGQIIDFKIIYANRNLTVLKGRDPETILNKKVTEVYPNIKSSDLFEYIIRVTNTGKAESFEIHYPDDGNTGGWFEISLSKLNDGVTLTGRDINHIKRYQAEQQQNIELLNSYVRELKFANEQLRQFNFIASHDLQEPLRKIQFFSNKMLEKSNDYPEIQTEIKKIGNSAARMSDLIVALTKYSRLQLGQVSLQLVDLNQVVNQVLSDLENQITEKKAVLNVDHLPTINGDPIQISQLFLQLLSNSLKFCTKRPEISISCNLVDDPILLESLQSNLRYIKLRFSDNGIGFNNEFSDKIFMIFQKLHSNRGIHGTGVGLALCKKIVENHKGKISVYSIENEGSTFDVYLPANLNLESN